MIVTVTMNPAIDKTAGVQRIFPRGLNRLTDVRRDVGGKGINVSKTIAALGGTSLATGFLAGQTGAAIQTALEAQEGITPDFIKIDGETRTNLKLVEPDGALTELNEQGPAATQEALEQLMQKIQTAVKPGSVLVLSGSVGPNVPGDIYRKLTETARNVGAKVILDADGALLEEGIQAVPDVVKPNEWELCRLFGKENASEEQLVEMGRKLNAMGIGTVCISRGAKGALCVQKDSVLRAKGLPIAVQSTVGAGDAMTAAFAFGLDSGWNVEKVFRMAVAAGTGACMTSGTTPPNKETVWKLMRQVQVEEI